MSIWHKEAVKVNGRIMAYVEVQNDWTGQVRGRVYTIRRKNGKAYVVADGQRIDVTKELERYEHEQDYIRNAIKWYKDTKF